MTGSRRRIIHMNMTAERREIMNGKKKIVKEYNGCEVTITFGGRNETAMEEAKRLIIESYFERIKYVPEIEEIVSEDTPFAS